MIRNPIFSIIIQYLIIIFPNMRLVYYVLQEKEKVCSILPTKMLKTNAFLFAFLPIVINGLYLPKATNEGNIK